jgi:tetratricopeptide (TPR) repeat protein
MTLQMPSPLLPPEREAERGRDAAPAITGGMTAQFASPFSSPPSFPSFPPEPSGEPTAGASSAPLFPPTQPADDDPFETDSFVFAPTPSADGAAVIPPTPEAAPLGFGEVDFGEPAPAPGAPVLGDAEEPFPFDTPHAASRPGRGPVHPPTLTDEPTDPAGVPLPPDPFSSGSLTAAPAQPFSPQGEDAPFAGAAPGAGDEFAVSDADPLSPSPDLGAVRGATPADLDASESLGGLGSLGAKETEELEMLFDEDAGRKTRAPAASPSAASATIPVLFRVRRRSGKVFGPFTEAEVVQMLSRGELLGNEDVSTDDGSTFRAIGTVPAFGAAMRRLMEAPGPAGSPRLTESGTVGDAKARPKAAPAGRMGRLAEDVRKLGASRWFKPALAGIALLLVLAVGFGAGVTPYGLFFHKLVLGQVGAKRPGAKLLADARDRLAQDGFTGVKGALELADRALRIQSSDREAKALYTYAASLLARRHGGAGEAWARSKGFLPELTAQIGEDPDAAKAVLSASLLPGERPADAAAAALQRHLLKSPRDADALLVLGDAALARADLVQAAGLYARLDALRPGAARSAHALGMVALRRGDAAAAQKYFEAALAQEPSHLASAVELAQLAMAAGNLPRAEQFARRALASEPQGPAGPAERALSRVVLAQALARMPGSDLEQRLGEAEKELESAAREDPENVPVRLALAAFELDRNSPEKASAALEPVLATGRDPRLADLQARALARQGRVLDAFNLLDGSLGKWPGDPRLIFAKGLVAQMGGKHADAEKLWADAAARAPESWEPHLALGRAKLARGELDDAEKELELAADRAPMEGEALSGVADLLLARKDLSGAETGYRRALAVDPAHAEAYLGLARVALARSDGTAARASLEKALRLDPRLSPAQAALGEQLWKARDLAGARQAFRAAVSLDPRDGITRGRLGAVELEEGAVDAALSDLLAASNLEIASAEIRGWYGQALLAKGEVPQAIEQLRKAVELDPRTAHHQLQLGQALERAGSSQEAVDAYRSAQDLAPALVEPYEAMAALYAGQNRCGDALPQLDKALALAPREQRLRVAAGDCKMRLGKHADAAAAYKRALQADPKLVGLYYKIARAEHEAAGRAGALPWYERAAREEPRNPMPHYYLGFAYKERGQRARAIQAFRAYLAAKPDAEDKKDIEREIEDLGGAP